VDYKIVDKPAFKVVGKALRVTTRNNEQYRRIPEFWTELSHDGSLDLLTNLAAGLVLPTHAKLGICTDFSPQTEEFTYLIAVEKPDGVLPEFLDEVDVSASTWAVFEAVGHLPESIQSVWQRIWPEFFNITEYKHADAPEIEVYPHGDDAASNYRCEVWIPIVKQASTN